MWNFTSNHQCCQPCPLITKPVKSCMSHVSSEIVFQNEIIEPEHDKPTQWPVHPAKTQINLSICPDRSECAFYRKARTQCFFMPTAKTLIRGWPGWSESLLGTWVLLLVLLCSGSIITFLSEASMLDKLYYNIDYLAINNSCPFIHLSEIIRYNTKS